MSEGIMAEAVYLREYETIYILRPEATDDAVEKLNGRVKGVLDQASARVLRHEVWGKKKLAYEVKKNQKGIFIYLHFLSGNALVAELERNFRMWEDVIKFQTVKLHEEVDADARMKEIPPPGVEAPKVEPKPAPRIASVIRDDDDDDDDEDDID
jgi:small subunit ribosomal protein S6